MLLPLAVNGSEDIILLPNNDAIISSVKSAIDMLLFQFTMIFDIGSTILCLRNSIWSTTRNVILLGHVKFIK